MNLEQSQILANIASALANMVASGVMSREQAKGIVKPFLPNENISNNTVSKTRGVGIKQTVTSASDIKEGFV